MTPVALTVASKGGVTVASVSMDFNPDLMLYTRANSADATKTNFLYPDGKGGYEEIIVTEAIAAVRTLTSTSSTATTRKQVTVLFDATGGKAVGAYSAVDAATGAPVVIPSGSRITRAFYSVLTTFTSPTTDDATISVGLLTDDVAGIVAATAIDGGGNVWDAGLHEAIQTGSAATMGELTTADRAITVTVGVEGLTAGKFKMVLEYSTNLN